jgi:hypothetical protein
MSCHDLGTVRINDLVRWWFFDHIWFSQWSEPVAGFGETKGYFPNQRPTVEGADGHYEPADVRL